MDFYVKRQVYHDDYMYSDTKLIKLSAVRNQGTRVMQCPICILMLLKGLCKVLLTVYRFCWNLLLASPTTLPYTLDPDKGYAQHISIPPSRPTHGGCIPCPMQATHLGMHIALTVTKGRLFIYENSFSIKAGNQEVHTIEVNL